MKAYGPSKLRGGIDPPRGFDPQSLLRLWEAATREIADYTALIVLEDGRTGSGTFVTANGIDGILTAHHVATKLIKPNSVFHLVITSYAHKLPVSSTLFEHVVIGDSNDNPRPHLGPDLSFLRILDVRLLSTIKGRKSFLRLDGKNFSFFRRHLKRRMKWFVAGAPYEFAEPTESHGVPPEQLTKLSSFVGDAIYRSITDRNGFDDIKVNVPSGEYNFPARYGGVSGGGIWMVPLSIGHDEDLKTIRYEAPFLAGVVFFESPMRNKERVITGHGPNSIYAPSVQLVRGPVDNHFRVAPIQFPDR